MSLLAVKKGSVIRWMISGGKPGMQGKPEGRERVLIVDDEDGVRESLRDILTSAGITGVAGISDSRTVLGLVEKARGGHPFPG